MYMYVTHMHQVEEVHVKPRENNYAEVSYGYPHVHANSCIKACLRVRREGGGISWDIPAGCI